MESVRVAADNQAAESLLSTLVDDTPSYRAIPVETLAGRDASYTGVDSVSKALPLVRECRST